MEQTSALAPAFPLSHVRLDFAADLIEESKQYRTISAVRFVKSFRSDAGGRAKPPGAFDPTPADSLRSSADRGSSRSAFGLRTGRDVRLVHTIKSEDLTPFLRKLRNWSFRIKGVLNDQSGSVRNSLSVRHRRPCFARPPIGLRRDRLSIRTGR